MLGAMAGAEQVAYLRVAERGAMLIALSLSVVDIILGPQIVRCMKDDDRATLQPLARRSVRLTACMVVPASAVLLLWGRPLISLTFGPAHAATSCGPLAVLVISQGLFSLMGSAGLFLAMTGHERHNAIAQVLSLAVFGAVGSFSIPALGALGSALAAGLLGYWP